MNVLDLFSGIGGFSLGLERAGMRTVAFCEIDPFCKNVLKDRWPSTQTIPGIYGAEQLAKAGSETVITGGFPCQDISLAGEGAGLAGERSGLVWPLLRAIRLVRPRFAVLENVAALLGRGLGAVLGRMAEIGYDAEWHCIPASAVGAPHQRDRVWIIASDAGGEQHQGDSAPFSGTLAAQLSSPYSDAYGSRQLQPEGSERDERRWVGDMGEAVPDASSSRLSVPWPQSDGEDGQQSGGMPAPSDWWTAEPAVGRVADGVPNRVDRLRTLGNAVVPQIPEIIGKAIMSRAALLHEERGRG